MASTIRNTKDFFSGLLFTAIGSAALVLARDYEMGTLLRMGPGYYPSVLAGGLLLVGLICLVRSFRTDGTPIGRLAWKPMLLVVLPIACFGILIRDAGLVPAIVLLVMVSAYASERFSFKATVPLALGMCVFSWLIFIKGLGLPMQLLGPWFGF
ncbi:hypothetical protein GCM10007907_13630 [Chitinimonas prasina]|uniref:DUF1468 domain-containing protein n=1 Tax=Chitinimonas prasina TaxID=1434937 RepID=A0ABQ5YEZ4_9NEIS|nr:tripartite tricarboxylate transporter TctB family protein [Chitinimonas prasina]GLR12573.1 hypothetical protein GCM10007907_13630 [Chitinimonas prasina]